MRERVESLDSHMQLFARCLLFTVVRLNRWEAVMDEPIDAIYGNVIR